MSRKTLSKSEKRSERFNVYANEDEASIIRDKARKAGLSPTDFLRTAGLGKRVRETVPLVNLEKWKDLDRLIKMLDEIIQDPSKVLKDRIDMSWFRTFRWEVQQLRIDIISERSDDF